MNKDIRLALCQMKVLISKGENIKKAGYMLEAAAMKGAEIAVLPEMFNCPYDNRYFREYAESESGGETIGAISDKAKELGIYVVGGSIPEISGDHIYNTSFVFGRNGDIIGKHRKMHLFDIDIKGKIRFMESDVLKAGDKATVIDTEFCRIGIAVCYDMRFPELARMMALDGARILIFPGAFNTVTGPAHWELLVRTRALDNQVYTAAVSPARDEGASYRAYGHSMAADPWGRIIAEAGICEELICADFKKNDIDKIRSEMPLLQHRRAGSYKTDL